MNFSIFSKRHLLTLTILIGLVLIISTAAHLTGDRLIERITINLCISLILVLGLQIFMGNSGILSFAHIGFMGIGAYVSAILTIPSQMRGMALPDLYPALQNLQCSPYLAMLIAAVFAAALAALVSYPLMRLSDAAAVITSFALLVVLHTIILHWSEVTNGPRTIFGIPKVTGLPLATSGAVLAIVIALAFKESRLGLLLRAAKSDEVAAAALGAHIPRLRWLAFVLGAFLAGLAGAFWGHFITSFAPKAFYLKETFVILGMLVIGGPATVTGAVMGTIIITFTFEGLRTVENSLNQAEIFTNQIIGLTEVTLALAMIVILILLPGGIFATREIGTTLIQFFRPGKNK